MRTNCVIFRCVYIYSVDTHKTRPTRGSHIEVKEKLFFCRCSEAFVSPSMASVGAVKLFFCLVLWLSNMLSTSQGSLLPPVSFSFSSYLAMCFLIFILFSDLSLLFLFRVHNFPLQDQ
jgi:hypothetical protein